MKSAAFFLAGRRGKPRTGSAAPLTLQVFESCLRILAISSLEGDQFVSQVLQWNTSPPDFRVSSNCSLLKVTALLWLFGQTTSNSSRSFTSAPLFAIQVQAVVLRRLQRWLSRMLRIKNTFRPPMNSDEHGLKRMGFAFLRVDLPANPHV